jgi:hypothetical protein
MLPVGLTWRSARRALVTKTRLWRYGEWRALSPAQIAGQRHQFVRFHHADAGEYGRW